MKKSTLHDVAIVSGVSIGTWVLFIIAFIIVGAILYIFRKHFILFYKFMVLKSNGYLI